MNLTQYRAAIMSYSDFAPTNQTYSNELDGMINTAYHNIWNIMKWNFIQKMELIRFFPDITSARANNVTLNVLQYTRQVTFSAAVYQLNNAQDWEGQFIELNGRDYEILKVVSNTEIRLAEPYRGDALTLDTTWIIKHKYYYLPENCIDLISLAHRDNPYVSSGQRIKGKIITLSSRNDEIHNLQEDKTADSADVLIRVPPVNIPPGEKLSYTYEEVNPSTANIPDNYYFEMCWAFETKGGRVGPLSQPLIGFTGEAEKGLAWTIQVNFLSHDDVAIQAPAYVNTRDTWPNPYEGLRKRVYFNQNFNHVTGERLGLPLWREIKDVGTVATQYNHLPIRVEDEVPSVVIHYVDAMNPSNPRYIETDGQHLRIRPYPRIDSWDEYVEYDGSGSTVVPEEYMLYGELRYLYKPHMLCSATDSPEMPYEFHELLLWSVLKDVYYKHGDLQSATMYEARVEKAVKNLAKRYTEFVDILPRKAQFGIIPTRGQISAIWHNGIRYSR